MNTTSRMLSGFGLIILGGYLTLISLDNFASDWPGLFWAITFIVLGIFILFNKKEDEIEKIKDDKNK